MKRPGQIWSRSVDQGVTRFHRLLLATACIAFVLFSSLSSYAAGQIIVNGGGQIIINGGAVIINNGAGLVNYYTGAPQETPPPPAAIGDLLHFCDGSSLHGQLSSIQNGQIVRWQNPDAARDIEFKTDNLDFIRFSHATPLAATAGCRVRLVNGDELLATLNSIDAENVELNTWFSGAAKIPRSAVESITLLATNFSIAYEGPVTDEGWTVTPTNAWWYRDGGFIGRGSGAVSRDFGIKGSSTVEFDMTTPGFFGLMINPYTDKQQLEYGGNCYCLTLTTDGIDLRRGQTSVAGGFGKAPWPASIHKNKIHITIQSNKEKNSLAVFADHQLVKRWEDKSGFCGNGTRFLFADASGRPGVVLSHFRASRWEGFEPEISASTETNSDCVALFNRDRASGKITGLANGKLGLDFGKRHLDIPLERVTRISFATRASSGTNELQLARSSAALAEENQGNVRAYLTGFGQISFKLDSWDTNHITGHSEIFGALNFPSQSVRQIDFNLNRPKEEAVIESADEFGGLDD